MGHVNDLAKDVLIEAFGASATPFVPVPFVDDWMLARLLRRIAGKVLARRGIPSLELAEAIVDAYVKEGASPLGRSILIGAARFVVRKVAVVLDVKKSHDVFGESIAFALALDIAVENGWVTPAGAAWLGAAIYRALVATSSGALEGLMRAGREAFARAPGADGQRAGIADAIGGEVEKLRDQLGPALRHAMETGPTR